jgi:hypothetical protein
MKGLLPVHTYSSTRFLGDKWLSLERRRYKASLAVGQLGLQTTDLAG